MSQKTQGFWALHLSFPIHVPPLVFCNVGGDEDHSDGRADPLREATELNGTYENTDTKRSELDSPTQGSPARPSAMENGLLETELPHGSTVGSNGYILSKQQEDTVSSPHRTNWSPVGGSTLGQGTKNISSAPFTLQSPDHASPNTDTSPGPMQTERRAEKETKNGIVSNTPPPVTIHRARKTMSRPASNQTLKVTDCVTPNVSQICNWDECFILHLTRRIAWV